TCDAGSTPSAYQIVPFTSATMATCAQPPTMRVHCISCAGLPPSTVVATGGSQRNRLSMPVRHWLAVASWASCAALPGPPERTRALGCCHVPQNTSALCPVSACCVHSSPTEFLPIATCDAGLVALDTAPRTNASGGGV